MRTSSHSSKGRRSRLRDARPQTLKLRFLRRRGFIPIAGNVSERCTRNGAAAPNRPFGTSQRRSGPVQRHASNSNLIRNLHPLVNPIELGHATCTKQRHPSLSQPAFPLPASTQMAARAISCRGQRSDLLKAATASPARRSHHQPESNEFLSPEGGRAPPRPFLLLAMQVLRTHVV